MFHAVCWTNQRSKGKRGPVLSNTWPSCQPSTSCTSVSGTYGIVVPWTDVPVLLAIPVTWRKLSTWLVAGPFWMSKKQTYSDLGRSYSAAREPLTCCLEFMESLSEEWNWFRGAGLDMPAATFQNVSAWFSINVCRLFQFACSTAEPSLKSSSTDWTPPIKHNVCNIILRSPRIEEIRGDFWHGQSICSEKKWCQIRGRIGQPGHLGGTLATWILRVIFTFYLKLHTQYVHEHEVRVVTAKHTIS